MPSNISLQKLFGVACSYVLRICIRGDTQVHYYIRSYIVTSYVVNAHNETILDCTAINSESIEMPMVNMASYVVY